MFWPRKNPACKWQADQLKNAPKTRTARHRAPSRKSKAFQIHYFFHMAFGCAAQSNRLIAS
jgi:hypothetical protein